MDEEHILKNAYDIKKNQTRFTSEEHCLIDIADAILLHRTAVVQGLESTVRELSDKILREVDDPKNWQPTDYLPEFSERWEKNIKELQDQARGLPPELKIVLVGDMITEEGLPTYQTALSRFDATRDFSGISLSPWAKFIRWWTAEENRHGDLLHTHMWLMNEYDMRTIERDIQYLIGTGFDTGIGEDPFKLIVYTSFQEMATFISHKGTARIAIEQGDKRLYEICNVIANDEARHYSFYKNVMKKIFDADPNGAMTSYAQMMKQTIPMPAQGMKSKSNLNVYTDFAEVAQSIGVYTSHDYAGIIEQLNVEWDVENQKVNTPEAAMAQKYVMKLPSRYVRVAEKRAKNDFKFDANKFDWLKTA